MADNKVQIDIELVTKSFKTALQDATKQVDGFAQASKKGFSLSKDAFNMFQGALLANAVTAGLGAIKDAASALWNTFIVDGVKASAATQDAINSLSLALANSGNYSKEAADDLVAYAGELQNTTKFGDDAVLSTMSLITSLSGLSGDGLKQATQASADLATALGIDLNSAANLVAKAANGQTEAFSRYGIKIQEGNSKSETFANTLQVLNSKFGGSAQGQLNTYSGAMARIQNAFSDFTKIIGNVITNNKVLMTVINGVSDIFNSITANSSGLSQSLSVGLGSAIIFLVDAFKLLVGTLDVFGRAWTILWNGAQVQITASLTGIVWALNKLGVVSDSTLEAFQNRLSTLKTNITDAFSGDTTLSKFGDKLGEISIRASQSLEDMRNGLDSTPEMYRNAGNKIVDAEKEKEDKLKDIRLQAAIAQEEWRLTQEASELRQRDEKFNTLVQQLGLEAATRRQAEINMTLDKEEQERLRFQTTVDYNKRLLEDRKKAIEDEKKANELREQNLRGTIGTISTLSSSGNKNLNAIGKAAALASIAIDTPKAVAKALASAPPPVNFALAGLVGTAMAAQAAKVAGLKFESGGIVPGTSYSGDRVQARVNSGEMILNKSQQSNLFKMVNSGGGSQDTSQVVSLLSGILNAIKQGAVIQIDGREIINVVRDGLSAGRSLA